MASSMSPELAQAIISSAKRIGANPLDLATVISYESGGTFSPSKWGGKDGNYVGLIQAGAEERKRYGINENQTAQEQLGGVERYLTDRGFKPGMGRLDLYSTINAGRPGLYNRSDADNGGAPGTVADKVRDQMGAHEEKAKMLLGLASGDGSIDPAPMANSPTSLLSPDQVGALQTTTAAQPQSTSDVLKNVSAILQGQQPGQQQPQAAPQQQGDQFLPLQQIQAARPAGNSASIAQALARMYGIS